MFKTMNMACAIPAKAGIGLRAQHYRELLDTLPGIGWLEGHSENYFGAGGPPLYFLEQLRSRYLLSLHGVGLSLGSADPLDFDHLGKLKSLIERFEPAMVSEHLVWSSIAGRYLNDLLPLPYTEEALRHVCDRIAMIQEFLGRQILIENISSYLQFKASDIPEWEFLAAVYRRSGCAILLDVNNIYVNSVNHGFDPLDYLRAIPAEAVQEIHLAGFEHYDDILIDTHGKPVYPEVWDLYRKTALRFGRVPTLIEWDTNIPALSVLLEEARKADAIMEEHYGLAA
jgi:uncharacterized protein